jgi:hypothetical protein
MRFTECLALREFEITAGWFTADDFCLCVLLQSLRILRSCDIRVFRASLSDAQIFAKRDC